MTTNLENRTDETKRLRDLYLDLMKRSLLDSTHGAFQFSRLSSMTPWKQAVIKSVEKAGFVLVKKTNPKDREQGRDWPLTAHTMIGEKRLDCLQRCVEEVLERDIPGDLIETGVWRGGASILMRAVLKAYGVTQRTVWVADSFQGLPPPTSTVDREYSDRYLVDNSILAVSCQEVKDNFAGYGLLDDRVVFLEGWFKDTLPKAPIQQLAVVRLDGDLYESTMDALVHLYPKLSIGGYVIIDDFNSVEACQRAVMDYRSRQGIAEPIQEIDSDGAFWKRTN